MPVRWLDKEKCLRLLEKTKYGRLATCGEDNLPYITPLNFVLLRGKIYFHCGFSGRKIKNIITNPQVCFEISRLGKLYSAAYAKNFTFRFWSVLVFGSAMQVQDEKLKLEIINKIMQKYAHGYDFLPPTPIDAASVNIVEIKINEISGKVSVDPV